MKLVLLGNATGLLRLIGLAQKIIQGEQFVVFGESLNDLVE